jgi:hypothetical protein
VVKGLTLKQVGELLRFFSVCGGGGVEGAEIPASIACTLFMCNTLLNSILWHVGEGNREVVSFLSSPADRWDYRKYHAGPVHDNSAREGVARGIPADTAAWQ